MKVEIMNTIHFPFEKYDYDTIILDSPYLTAEECNEITDTGKWKGLDNHKEIMIYDLNCSLIVDRIFKYAYKNKTWLIIFHKRPLMLSRYTIVWRRKKVGLGFNIGRNAEYIHLVNYHGLTLPTVTETKKPILNEIESITTTEERTCSKPIELYTKLFQALQSKRIFDPFTGYGNSVIAAKDLGLEIDAFDKDESLKERFEFLRNYRPSRISSFLKGVESET